MTKEEFEKETGIPCDWASEFVHDVYRTEHKVTTLRPSPPDLGRAVSIECPECGTVLDERPMTDTEQANAIADYGAKLSEWIAKHGDVDSVTAMVPRQPVERVKLAAGPDRWHVYIRCHGRLWMSEAASYMRGLLSDDVARRLGVEQLWRNGHGGADGSTE